MYSKWMASGQEQGTIGHQNSGNGTNGELSLQRTKEQIQVHAQQNAEQPCQEVVPSEWVWPEAGEGSKH